MTLINAHCSAQCVHSLSLSGRMFLISVVTWCSSDSLKCSMADLMLGCSFIRGGGGGREGIAAWNCWSIIDDALLTLPREDDTTPANKRKWIKYFAHVHLEYSGQYKSIQVTHFQQGMLEGVPPRPRAWGVSCWRSLSRFAWCTEPALDHIHQSHDLCINAWSKYTCTWLWCANLNIVLSETTLHSWWLMWLITSTSNENAKYRMKMSVYHMKVVASHECSNEVLVIEFWNKWVTIFLLPGTGQQATNRFWSPFSPQFEQVLVA